MTNNRNTSNKEDLFQQQQLHPPEEEQQHWHSLSLLPPVLEWSTALAQTCWEQGRLAATPDAVLQFHRGRARIVDLPPVSSSSSSRPSSLGWTTGTQDMVVSHILEALTNAAPAAPVAARIAKKDPDASAATTPTRNSSTATNSNSNSNSSLLRRMGHWTGSLSQTLYAPFQSLASQVFLTEGDYEQEEEDRKQCDDQEQPQYDPSNNSTHLAASGDHLSNNAVSATTTATTTKLSIPWSAGQPSFNTTTTKNKNDNNLIVSLDVAVTLVQSIQQCLVQVRQEHSVDSVNGVGTVVPARDLQSWLVQKHKQQLGDSNKIIINTTTTTNQNISSLLARLPADHFNLLIECVVRQSALSSSSSYQALSYHRFCQADEEEGTQLNNKDHVSMDRDAVFVIGGGAPGRYQEESSSVVQVQLTLYRLERTEQRIEAQISSWRQQAEQLGQQALVAAKKTKQQQQQQDHSRPMSSSMKSVLMRRQLLLQQAEIAEATLLTVLTTRHAVETAASQRSTVAALKAAASTLQSLRLADDSSSSVHDVMDDLQEEMDHLSFATTNTSINHADDDDYDDETLLQDLMHLTQHDPQESVAGVAEPSAVQPKSELAQVSVLFDSQVSSSSTIPAAFSHEEKTMSVLEQPCCSEPTPLTRTHPSPDTSALLLPAT